MTLRFCMMESQIIAERNNEIFFYKCKQVQPQNIPPSLRRSSSKYHVYIYVIYPYHHASMLEASEGWSCRFSDDNNDSQNIYNKQEGENYREFEHKINYKNKQSETISLPCIFGDTRDSILKGNDGVHTRI